MRRSLLVVVLLLFLTGCTYFGQQKPEYFMTAFELQKEYSADADLANLKYRHAVIKLSGLVYEYKAYENHFVFEFIGTSIKCIVEVGEVVFLRDYEKVIIQGVVANFDGDDILIEDCSLVDIIDSPEFVMTDQQLFNDFEASINAAHGQYDYAFIELEATLSDAHPGWYIDGYPRTFDIEIYFYDTRVENSIQEGNRVVLRGVIVSFVYYTSVYIALMNVDLIEIIEE